MKHFCFSWLPLPLPLFFFLANCLLLVKKNSRFQYTNSLKLHLHCRLPLLICVSSLSSSSYRYQNLINFCSTKAYLFFYKLTCAIDAGAFSFFKGVLSYEFQLITISLQVSLLMICHCPTAQSNELPPATHM